MMMHLENILYLVFLWSGYFAIHSLLASLTMKQWCQKNLPQVQPYYRISYNILAVLLLIFPIAFTIANAGEPLWQWQGSAKWLVNGLAVMAIGAFLWTMRFYDMREFVGITQARSAGTSTQESFKISPLHRYVRHPWYSLALIIIWSRDMDSMYLTTALTLTLYFFLGAWLEEKKLLAVHGDIYNQYCKKVPGIIPRPWRFLSKAQAKQLQSRKTSTE
jgi:protein-S-isoprenylcysteine O-methyltransferase Ste14